MDEILKSTVLKLDWDWKGLYLYRKELDNLIIQWTHVLYILWPIEQEIYGSINWKKKVVEIINELEEKYKNENIKDDVTKFLLDMKSKKIIDFSENE